MSTSSPERDGRMLFLSMKRLRDCIYVETWRNLPAPVRDMFVGLAASAWSVHGLVDGGCVCGDRDCCVVEDLKMMDSLPKGRVE